MKNQFLRSLIALGLVTLSASAFASADSTANNTDVQYFAGKVQPSSLDGKTPYGPAVDSTVRRIVNRQDGIVIECVLQKGQMFYTTISRTSRPLVYSVRDSGDSFNGTLTFKDETLSAWSYDIQVTKPNQGHITGSLPDHGATILPQEKKMLIKKLWDNRVLITEEYDSIAEADYLQQVTAATAANPSLKIPSECQNRQ